MTRMSKHNWNLIAESKNCIVYENVSKDVIRIYSNLTEIKVIALDCYKTELDKCNNYHYKNKKEID